MTIESRLRWLEDQTTPGKDKGHAEILQRQFQLVPTCPPSATIRVLGGTLLRNAFSYGYYVYDMQVPENEIDFSDPVASEIDVDASFATAHYYKACLVTYGWSYVHNRNVDPSYGPSGNYTYKFNVFGGVTEHQTAASAEAEIDLLLNGGENLNPKNRFKLGGVILRNDGTTGVNGAVLPIDAVNRGRSYLYRDARLQTPIT